MGSASAGQFNFSGLGTTGGGVAGNSFPDVRTGNSGAGAAFEGLCFFGGAEPGLRG